MIDDLVAWLRAQLEHHADVHRKLVDAEGEDLPGERECDPDGFWAVYDAHTGILDLVNLDFNDDGQPITLGGYGEAYWDVVRLIAHAYRHRPGYREEWPS